MTAADPVNYLSVCSGLEGASLATEGLGWNCVAVAETEAFPSAVIRYRYPHLRNLGDLTKIDIDRLPPVKVLIAGTPCQSFSAAGRGLSLADARGNVTLAFVVLAHELARRNDGIVVLWENVPGIFSRGDNPFGCLVSAFVGHNRAFPQPRGAGWPSAGLACGPRGRAAWRVLDAQYFGLAQRRERVFLVVDLGAGADPAKILLESKSLQGNPEPRRPSGQNVAGTFGGRSPDGGVRTTDLDNSGAFIPEAQPTGNAADRSTVPVLTDEPVAFTCKDHGQDASVGIAPTLRAMHENPGVAFNGGGQVAVAYAFGAHAGTAEGEAINQSHAKGGPVGSDIQKDVAYSLRADRTQAVAYIHPRILRNSLSSNQVGIKPDAQISDALTTEGPGAVAFNVEPFTFDTTQLTHHENRSQPAPGKPCHTLPSDGHPPALAEPVAFAQNERAELRLQGGGDISGAVNAEPGTHGRTYVAEPVTLEIRGREEGLRLEMRQDGLANALRGSNGGRAGVGVGAVLHQWAVRRLTPVETERLQGVPDNWTRIPWKGKPAEQCPDGPRYKIVGNAWAIPVVHWICQRIDAELKSLST